MKLERAFRGPLLRLTSAMFANQAPLKMSRQYFYFFQPIMQYSLILFVGKTWHLHKTFFALSNSYTAAYVDLITGARYSNIATPDILMVMRRMPYLAWTPQPICSLLSKASLFCHYYLTTVFLGLF